ncbi:hypothetical protein LTR85_000015 [Meristemomyces frigidus]|nr:hypothetical protein LTR85_000015 [Meristemomyces frigidus]
MSREAAARRTQLKKLTEGVESDFTPATALLNQLSSVQGASETELHEVFRHAHGKLTEQMKAYTKALDSFVLAVTAMIDQKVENLGWDGEDGGPGTQGMRDKIFELVKERWMLERMTKRLAEKTAVGLEG